MKKYLRKNMIATEADVAPANGLATSLDDELLGESYYGKSVDERCKAQVLEFIAAHESVLGEDLLTIKRLTRVAHKICFSDLSLPDNIVEKLLLFNLEGITLINSDKKTEYEPSRLQTIESHLYAYAAEAAKVLAYKTGELSWAKQWHNLRMISATKSGDSDPKHSAHSYSIGGQGAKSVFNAIKKEDVPWKEKVYWTKQWYGAYMLSAIISEGFDLEHSAHSYSNAADAAKAVYDILDEIEGISLEEKVDWAKKWYSSNKSSATLSMDFDQKHAAHSYYWAAEAASNVFSKTKNPTWAIESIEKYERFLKYYESQPGLAGARIDQLIHKVRANITYLKEEIGRMAA